MIARELNLQVSTIKTYVRTVIHKLGATNRVEAAVLLTQIDELDVISGAPSSFATWSENVIRPTA